MIVYYQYFNPYVYGHDENNIVKIEYILYLPRSCLHLIHHLLLQLDLIYSFEDNLTYLLQLNINEARTTSPYSLPNGDLFLCLLCSQYRNLLVRYGIELLWVCMG